jgi:hypothetical protein
MIRFFTGRNLAGALDINNARWKRWSREFLPPDPLGGLQSGFARQYTPDDAFKVYLGGFLVGQLNFSIPDARQIITDLSPWMRENGFLESGESPLMENKLKSIPVLEHIIEFSGGSIDKQAHYRIRAIISRSSENLEGVTVFQEKYLEREIPGTTLPKNGAFPQATGILFISRVHAVFEKKIGIVHQAGMNPGA